MGHKFWNCLAVATCGLLLGAPSVASAQSSADATRAAARSLGTTGVGAYQAGDYETAHDKLEKAYQILKAPSLGLWSARALVKVGKLVEAGERYTEVTRLSVASGDAAVQKQAQDDAQTELDALGPRIPGIIIQLEGADAASVSVSLDGQPVASALIGESRPVDPGQHHVEGTRGTEHVTSDVNVAIGEKVPAVLKFTATTAVVAPPASSGAEPSAVSPAPPPDSGSAPVASATHQAPLKTVGWVGVGVGGVGIAIGAVAGVIALGKQTDIKNSDACKAMHCLPSEASTVNSYNSMRTLSSVGFIAGGVLATTGVVLLLTSGQHEAPSARRCC